MNLFSRLVLFPVFLLYSLVVYLRNQAYNRAILRGVKFDIPIINVGNLSAGGNGKTPHVEYIANLLTNDYKVAVLSRGYGRKSKGYHEVSTSDSALFSGDEPLQIKLKFGEKIIVFVGEDRVEAINKMLFEYPDIQVIILDDAFQHRAIIPGLNLLLTDFSKPFIDDELIPFGRLREHKTEAKRANMIVITKTSDDFSEMENFRKQFEKYSDNIVFSGLKYDRIVPVDKTVTNSDSKKYLLITAIANNKPLVKYLRKNYSLVDVIQFKDHHRFTKKDLELIGRKITNFADPNLEVLTTSKDIVRFNDLINFNSSPFKFNIIPVRPYFIGLDDKIFNDFIINYVRKNTTNCSIFTGKD